MGRSPCCAKEGLNRGAWTAHEDKILKEYIRVHGEGRWRNLPKKAGLKRCGKSCRLRWLNYLRPDIKRGNISSDEEELIIRLHKLLGNRWSLIAGRLPGRTDNEIKNYWNTNLSKKVKDGHHQSNTPCRSRVTCTQRPPENPKPNVTHSLTPPKLDSSYVVRTKATKCSKVLLINPPHLPHYSSLSSEAREIKQVNDASTSNIIKEDKSSSSHQNGFLSEFLTEEKETSSTDLLLIDYNVGDVCLSDLLNSDFSNMCDLMSYNNNDDNDELLSPCNSDQPDPLFSQEILNKDWTHFLL